MNTYPLHFIHASDLHLDAVFPGLSKEVPACIATQLHDATFTALQRLIDLCIREKPNFILLVGDIYNEEDHSLRATLALRDACIKLHTEQIPVFIVHGNHDPFSSRFQTISWPENVTIFGTEIENKNITAKDGTLLARIYGISHATNKEHKNLSELFQPTEDTCLHIALLHCSVDESPLTERYAPCSLKDLKNRGMDYWALGHIHKYQELSKKPLVLYPGCTQGLRISEQGKKGCVLVTAESTGNTYTFHTEFHHLGPVVWHTLDIPIQDAELSLSEDILPSNDAIFDYIKNAIFNSLDQLFTDFGPNCETIILRVTLSGKTYLDTHLRKASFIVEILENLRDIFNETHTPCWLKDILVLTTPIIDREKILERTDLLGEIFRLSNIVASTDENVTAFCQKALSPLYSNRKLTKFLNNHSIEDYKQLLLEAEYICAEMLEKK